MRPAPTAGRRQLRVHRHAAEKSDDPRAAATTELAGESSGAEGTSEPAALKDEGVVVLDRARWWTMRRAQNGKGSDSRCPLCGERLHAMSEHMLLLPEGDARRRRHAHTECVLAARHEGVLATLDEWRAIHPERPGLLRRLLGRA